MEKFLKWKNSFADDSVELQTTLWNSNSKNILFEKLFKVKGFTDVAEELMTIIKPVSEVEKIRLNLNYFSKQDHKTENELKILKLREQIEEAKLENQVEANELKALIQEDRELENEEKNLMCQISILKEARHEYENKTHQLDKANIILSSICPDYLIPSTPEEEAIKLSNAQRSLNCILKELEAHTDTTHLFNKEFKCEHEKLEKIFQSCQHLKEQYIPMLLIEALKNMTNADIEVISSLVPSHFSSHGFDVKGRNGGKLPMNSIMNEYLKLKEENKDRKKRYQMTLAASQEIKTSVENTVEQKFGDDPELSNNIKKFCETTMRLSGLKSSSSVADQLLKETNARSNALLSIKEGLVDTEAKVLHYEQVLLQTLKHLRNKFSGFDQNLALLEIENKKTLELGQSLAVKNNDSNASILKNAFSKEMSLLSEDTFKQLFTFKNSSSRLPENHVQLCDFVCGPGKIRSIIDEKRDRKEFSESELKSRQETLNSIEKMLIKSSISREKIKELTKKVKENDERVESSVSVMLNNSEKLSDQTKSRCDKLENAVQLWWNQPGDEISNYKIS